MNLFTNLDLSELSPSSILSHIYYTCLTEVPLQNVDGFPQASLPELPELDITLSPSSRNSGQHKNFSCHPFTTFKTTL